MLKPWISKEILHKCKKQRFHSKMYLEGKGSRKKFFT